MESLLGIYRAIVTDVSCFESTGKIKTKISCFNNNYVEYDLVNDYNTDKYKNQVAQDKYTFIFMPFGGGYDYGMFKLPEVNSIGLVQFIDGNPKTPIWIGSYNASIIKTDGSIIENGIPSDNIKDSESALYTKERDKTFSFNMENKHSFIIKTKENTLEDLSDSSTMNWKNNKIDNTLILNKEKAALNHNIVDGEDYLLKLDNNEISLNYINEGDDNNKKVKITSDGMEVSSKNGNIGFSAKLNKNKFVVNTSDSSGNKTLESIIEQSPSQIKIESGDSSIIIRTKASKDEVIISSSIIRLSADSIIMGNTGYSLVGCPKDNLSITLEDGTMLSTINTIKV